MWLIVGLGNPGAKYLSHRHNIGFMALDFLLRGYGAPKWKEEKKALTARLMMEDIEVLFAKPQTFMNKSGESVRELIDYYKIEIKELLVVHDDIDQAFGSMRVHQNRGHGGQNGVRHIHEILATSDYGRLKLGIGRPTNAKMDVASFVLQAFSEAEQALLPDFLNCAGDAIETVILSGFAKAATEFNKQVVVASTP